MRRRRPSRDHRGWGGGRRGAIRAAILLTAVLFIGACGSDEEPDLTFEERLDLLETRPLTPAQVADRVQVGEALCRLDDAVLDEIWFRLDEDQLDFQDIVVASLCPERAVFYAGRTGRYVTAEAEQSGVITSTSRPTTTFTSVTSGRPATAMSGPTTAVTGPAVTGTGPNATSTQPDQTVDSP